MNLLNENPYTIIGLITIKFSRLDYLTLEYISILECGYVSLENKVIFQDFTLDKKVQILEKLIQLKYNGRFEKLQLEFIQRLKKLKDKRNLFIHGAWSIPQTDNLMEINKLSVKSFKYELSRPNKTNNDKMIDKMWHTNNNEDFTKLELIEFHNDIEMVTDALIEIMEENEKIR
jgi:hypothetical protein